MKDSWCGTGCPPLELAWLTNAFVAKTVLDSRRISGDCLATSADNLPMTNQLGLAPLAHRGWNAAILPISSLGTPAFFPNSGQRPTASMTC